MRSTGGLLVVAGAALMLIGLLVGTGALSWFGRLPGDLRFETEHTRVYIPLTSMLLLSLVFSLVAYVVRRML
ncbi:DUF2905 domain-containing protein [Corallococcus sp. H22C18031201]|nr:DUF2905 domain-containing protein [Citreicoccus inhibens]RJS23027.1 DUF2905 domain-containing protein [Corallococcus sp. H22C18031201]